MVKTQLMMSFRLPKKNLIQTRGQISNSTGERLSFLGVAASVFFYHAQPYYQAGGFRGHFVHGDDPEG